MALSRREYRSLTPDEKVTLRKALLRSTYIHGYAELAIVTNLSPETLRDYKYANKYGFPQPIPGRSVRHQVWSRKAIENWLKNRAYFIQPDHVEANV